MSKKTPDAKRILLLAAHIIETEQWAQGVYERVDLSTGECAYCLAGALYEAASRLRSKGALREDPLRRAVQAAKTAVEISFGGPIDIWNDAPGRNKSEAVDALRSAALEM